jgi:hypothetical protein
MVGIKKHKSNFSINIKEVIKIVAEFKRVTQLVAISKDISQIIAVL